VPSLPAPQGDEIQNPGIPEGDLERVRRRNLFRDDVASIRDPGPLQRPMLLRIYDRVGPLLPRAGRSRAESTEEAVRALFGGTFADANQELSAMIGRDLGRFGYELA
jgi:hypothetical protein